MKDFTALDTAVIGCSADSVEAQAKFKVKQKLNFPLLSDPEFNVIEPFGARRMKLFLGKSYLGIVRMTYWVGADGKIRKIWDKASSKGHAAEVLAAVQAAHQAKSAD
jgi:thioredoxin-dependent peroxiredoxin